MRIIIMTNEREKKMISLRLCIYAPWSLCGITVPELHSPDLKIALPHLLEASGRYTVCVRLQITSIVDSN